MSPIEIIDVIHHYHAYSFGKPQIHLLLNRLPEFLYEMKENRLEAHDSGMYDFMYILGGTKAFGGRKFDLNMKDGSKFHCHGQVWQGGTPEGFEPTMEVGYGTLDSLNECYVFCAGTISRAMYDRWMENNQPSYNSRKYDHRETLEYLNRLYFKRPIWDRPVSKKRAKNLRKRGVTIQTCRETWQLSWSPFYERRKAEILERMRPDYGKPDHLKNEVAP